MSKNYLITGAARGIGRGLTRFLIAEGHRVFLVDNNRSELEHVSTQLKKWFPDNTTKSNAAHETSSSDQPTDLTPWQTFHGDLSQHSTIQQAADSASAFFKGHLDVLINNAAYTSAVGGPHLSSPDFLEAWSTSLAVNLTGSCLLSRACLPLLKRHSDRAHGGSIIMMSSTRAYQSEPNSEGYAATKAGLIGLTHAMACSLAGDGVRVNAVLPGWIHVADESKEADQKGVKWEDGLSKEDQRWHWAGRVGKVEDVCRAVEYLVRGEGDDGGFITGTEMVVDGGVTRRMVYPE